MTHKEKLEGITELEKNHQKRIESKRKKTEKSKKKYTILYVLIKQINLMVKVSLYFLMK